MAKEKHKKEENTEQLDPTNQAWLKSIPNRSEKN